MVTTEICVCLVYCPDLGFLELGRRTEDAETYCRDHMELRLVIWPEFGKASCCVISLIVGLDTGYIYLYEKPKG